MENFAMMPTSARKEICFLDQGIEKDFPIFMTGRAREKRPTQDEWKKTDETIPSLSDEAKKIAHDFGNVLNIIMGNLELCMDMGDNLDRDRMSRSLEAAYSACQRAAKLNEKLVEVSKSKEDETGKKIRKTSLVGTLKEIARIAESPKHECIVSVPEDLWKAEVDTEKIDSVFQNLIVNARQEVEEAGKSGTISIKAENVSIQNDNEIGLEKGRYICISVIDNGRGIPKTLLRKIFKPKFTTKKGGMGFGLHMAKNVVESHGGAITVKTKIGQGTTFSVYLPAISEDPLTWIYPIR